MTSKAWIIGREVKMHGGYNVFKLKRLLNLK